MQLIRQPFELRRTGIMARVRLASEQRKSFVLRTAVEAYSYHNFRGTMLKYGFRCYARRHGETIRVCVNCPPPPLAAPVKRPALRKALMELKPGSDCLLLTTPLEVHYFVLQRSAEFRRRGLHFHSQRNGVNVKVWKKV